MLHRVGRAGNMQLGKFDILEELGHGGFGTVYKARDLVLDRLVAIKVLHPNLVNDPLFLSRFKQEAQIAAQIEHANLVPIYDFGEIDGHFFIVMGYMPGGSLKELLKKEGPLKKERALEILDQIGKGLAYAHKRGVIHRDLKPGNILFDDGGVARISDMGFAKLLHSEGSGSMSTSGGLVGTPAYIAPEVWKDASATTAVDVYSAACILVEMLSGKPLFDGDSTPSVMLKHFEPLKLPGNLPDGWKPIIENALEKEPNQRTSSTEEIVRSLRAVDEGTFRPTTKSKNYEHQKKEKSKKAEDHFEQKGTKQKDQKIPTLTLAGIPLIVLIAIYFVFRSGVFTPQPKPTATSQPQLTQTFVAVVEMQNSTEVAASPQPSPTAEPLPTPTLGIGSVMIRERDNMEMVYVPEGSFEMGSEKGQQDEKPVRQIYLDSYWIDKYEVTNAQYALCVEDIGCTEPIHTNSYSQPQYFYNPTFGNYPVVYITWEQALDYCTWAGGDLPTEAQWEKAARGTDGRIYPWGNTAPDTRKANYGVGNDTMVVGSYPDSASPYGALDMAGNAWEWVRDWYWTYDASETKNPVGPDSGISRVLRGGWWDTQTKFLRTSYRVSGLPTTTYYNYGVRCVQSP